MADPPNDAVGQGAVDRGVRLAENERQLRRIDEGRPAEGVEKLSLQTRRGRQRYALRMQTVEPVFGQIKQGRGFRQFLLRGLEKVNGEWSLICTGHNLLKLFRFGVNLHRKARVDGPAQRIRNSCRGSEHGAIRKAI